MNSETKICPYCSEEILATAQKCKHCGEWLNESKTQNFDKKIFDKNIDKFVWIICIAIVLFVPMPFGVACLVGTIGGIIGFVIKECSKYR